MSGTKVKGVIRSSHSVSFKYGFSSAHDDLGGAVKNLKRKGLKGWCQSVCFLQFLCEGLRVPSSKATKHMQWQSSCKNWKQTQIVLKARWCFSSCSYFICPVNKSYTSNPTTQLEWMCERYALTSYTHLVTTIWLFI